ncbi:MAG: OmpA family protein [Candidatus Kapaibacterium sp.]
MPIRLSAICLTLITLFFSCEVFAQERSLFGIFGDFSLNQHSANFQQLPGVPSCCPRYETGNGTGPAFGGLYHLPLNDLFDLELRAIYRSLSGTLTETEGVTVLHNGAPVQGAFKHTLSSGLSTVGIEPMLGIKIVGDLRINIGLDIGLLLAKSYAQQEEIVQPDGAGTFLDSSGNDTHSRIRNQLTGTIANASALQAAIVGGISYPLPLNAHHTTYLVPEVLYNLGLTKIASDLMWNVNSIRFGFAIEFSPEKEAERRKEQHIDTLRITRKGIVAEMFIPGKEEHSEEVSEEDGIRYITEKTRRTDTLITPKKSELKSTIVAYGVDAHGTEQPIVRMTVEEFSSTLMTPLLNYIFFDENSFVIPLRYNHLDKVDTFSIEHIHSTAKVETYHHILNIVARRLRENPDAKITLTGCNQDIRDEKNYLELSRKRAESVKQYFTDAWHITPERIKIEVRNLSAKAANPQTADGADENRRVEITSTDPKILFPVITDDTLRISNPPTVRFKPQTTSEAGLASWNVRALQDKKTLKQFEGSSALPASLDWNIESASAPKFSGTMDYSLMVKDGEGNSSEAIHTIPVDEITIRKKREERRGDTVINRFSLILFDIGSSAITPTNAPIVTLIKEYVKPLSSITVTGYTDRLGDPVYNQKLAERRAAAIAASLGVKNIGSKGIGQADLYDSSLPEGRLYTRTVDVVIETPITP